MDIVEKVARNLRYWREEKEIRQRDMAELIGCSQGYMCQLEKGSRAANLKIIESASRVLRIEDVDLFATYEIGKRPRQRMSLSTVIDAWSVKGLMPMQRLALLALADIADERGNVAIDLEYLANELETDRANTIALIKSLEGSGCIKLGQEGNALILPK